MLYKMLFHICLPQIKYQIYNSSSRHLSREVEAGPKTVSLQARTAQVKILRGKSKIKISS